MKMCKNSAVAKLEKLSLHVISKIYRYEDQ